MGKHLKLFNLTSEYLAYAANISKMILPNISYCKDSKTKIYYNPLVIQEGSGSGSGSDEPSLEGNKVLCKYNVPVTNSSIVLYWASSGSGSGSGSGNGSENTPMFSSMEVDGVEQEVTHLYTFDTTGEHTILFTLAEGVTSIGVHAFYGSGSLTSVTIPNSVTSIDDYAFEGCSGLTSITIPDSVTSIGIGAFNACSGLTSITIPDSVTSIGDSAFRNCSGLTSVTINSDSIVSKTYTKELNIKNIFGTQVTEYIIGNSVTSIGDYAFYKCSGLTSVTISNSVTSIGTDAFFECSGLTSVNIPNSVTSIGNYVFAYCSGLTSITCNATTAPTVLVNTFKDVKTNGTLTVPIGSTGYDVWMGTGDYYLGKYNWTKVEA